MYTKRCNKRELIDTLLLVFFFYLKRGQRSYFSCNALEKRKLVLCLRDCRVTRSCEITFNYPPRLEQINVARIKARGVSIRIIRAKLLIYRSRSYAREFPKLLEISQDTRALPISIFITPYPRRTYIPQRIDGANLQADNSGLRPWTLPGGQRGSTIFLDLYRAYWKISRKDADTFLYYGYGLEIYINKSEKNTQNSRFAKVSRRKESV